MATEKPSAEYHSTMAQLYVIVRAMWLSHIENLAVIAVDFAQYTLVNANNALAQIDAAMALPMFQARNDRAEEAMTLMKQQAKLAFKRWKFLRNHIRNAYAVDLHKTKWESAGKAHYEKAANNNWGELQLMLVAGKNFIAANTAVLQAGGMPAGFPTLYNDAMDAFMGTYDLFLDAEQDEQEGTDEKVLANNVIYRRAMEMGEDVQLVFDDVPAKRQRFVFQHLKDTVTNPTSGIGPTSLAVRGIASNAQTASPMAQVPIVFSPLDSSWSETVETDDLGRFTFVKSGLEPNSQFDLMMSVTHPGFIGYSRILQAEAGQSTVVEVELTPMMPPPPMP